MTDHCGIDVLEKAYNSENVTFDVGGNPLFHDHNF